MRARSSAALASKAAEAAAPDPETELPGRLPAAGDCPRARELMQSKPAVRRLVTRKLGAAIGGQARLWTLGPTLAISGRYGHGITVVCPARSVTSIFCGSGTAVVCGNAAAASGEEAALAATSARNV